MGECLWRSKGKSIFSEPGQTYLIYSNQKRETVLETVKKERKNKHDYQQNKPTKQQVPNYVRQEKQQQTTTTTMRATISGLGSSSISPTFSWTLHVPLQGWANGMHVLCDVAENVATCVRALANKKTIVLEE